MKGKKHMSNNKTNKFAVKFIKEDAYGFKKGETCTAFKPKSKLGKEEMLCVLDKYGDEYAYPASWFEMTND